MKEARLKEIKREILNSEKLKVTYIYPANTILLHSVITVHRTKAQKKCALHTSCVLSALSKYCIHE